MAADEARTLRIYCICGQKMKVTSAMSGRPGKCIACRQKLRIPEFDTLPEEIQSISLHDHPEYLRATVALRARQSRKITGKPAAHPAVEQVEYEPIEMELPQGREQERRIPLDVLEPLRLLVSLEHRLKHKLSLAAETEEGRANGFSRNELEERFSAVRDAREAFDESLRQRLTETVLELESISARVKKMRQSASKSEVGFSEYLGHMARLRCRRDTLERRKANLRGWLAVETPYEAGGYIRLALDRLPEEGSIEFHHEPNGDIPAVAWWMQALRAALESHGDADDSGGNGSEDQHERAAQRCAFERKEAEIAFCRGRIGRCAVDCGEDLDVLERQLGALRAQVSKGRIGVKAYDVREKQYRKHHDALEQIRETAEQALAANTPNSLPPALHAEAIEAPDSAPQMPPRANTHLMRLGSLLLFLSLYTPLFGAPMLAPIWMSPGPAQNTGLIMLVAGIAMLPMLGSFILAGKPAVRGMLALGCAATLAAGAGVYALWLGVRQESPQAAQAASDVLAAWPGLAAYGLAVLVLLGSGAATVLGRHVRRLSIAATVALALTGMGLAAAGKIDAHFGPAMEVHIETPDNSGAYPVQLDMLPRGFGIPSLGQDGSTAHFMLERAEAAGEWSFAGPPLSIIRLDSKDSRPDETDSLIQPGFSQPARFSYRLPAGSYRAALAGNVLASFELEAIAAPSPPPPVQAALPNEPAPASEQGLIPALEEAQIPSEPGGEPADGSAPSAPAVSANGIEVELRGVMAAQGREPQFTLDIYYPDGRVQDRIVSLGDTIDEPWFVAEYNPSLQTLTLSNEERFLILRNGQRVSLEEIPEGYDSP